MTQPARIAFIKHGGLTAGGTERWLQMMAARLNSDSFRIDYFYCPAAAAPGIDPDRKAYLERSGVRLIPFHVGQRDLKTATWVWRATNFWDVFNENDYDLIQTAKSGGPEYPFSQMKKPVVEYRTLAGLPDDNPNIVRSIHLSQWQRTEWFLRGGASERSAVIPIPAEAPAAVENLRDTLHIPAGALVAGFHQRADDGIYSPIPLAAYAALQHTDRHFIVMGGSPLYRQQAERLALRNVHLIPHSGDAAAISRFLNTLDIFAHGRKDGETFGTVFAEAMMHGKPCLSHRSPWANGQRETIGPAGFFAQNDADYTEKLRTLFDSAELRGRLAAKARQHAEMYFSVESAATHLQAIYAEILGRTHSTSKFMSYGISPLEFLYYGDIEDQHSAASHILTHKTPFPFAVHLLKAFALEFQRGIDGDAVEGLFGFLLAQRNSRSHVMFITPDPDRAETLNRTISLNNWENRVEIQAQPTALGAQADVFFIDGNARLAAVKDTLMDARPALFLFNMTDKVLLTDLRKHGYRLQHATEEGKRFTLALHAERHQDWWLRRLPALTRQYQLKVLRNALQRAGYLLLKGIRHPHRAWRGLRRKARNPSEDLRF